MTNLASFPFVMMDIFDNDESEVSRSQILPSDELQPASNILQKLRQEHGNKLLICHY